MLRAEADESGRSANTLQVLSDLPFGDDEIVRALQIHPELGCLISPGCTSSPNFEVDRVHLLSVLPERRLSAGQPADWGSLVGALPIDGFVSSAQRATLAAALNALATSRARGFRLPSTSAVEAARLPQALNHRQTAVPTTPHPTTPKIEYTGPPATAWLTISLPNSGAPVYKAPMHTRWVALTTLTLSCTQAKPDNDILLLLPAPEPPRAGLSCSEDTLCRMSSGAGDAGTWASCCETIWVRGDTFPMGFSATELRGAAEPIPSNRERDVSVSSFFLDRFEITRERLTSFAERYAGPPLAGAGAHPLIDDSGWHSEWDAELPASGELLRDALRRNAFEEPLDGVNVPASGLTWFVAFAFCIWDGGRLPTEAEWEFAAAGGALNQPYPWREEASLADSLKQAPLLPIGESAAPRGWFGHYDLAGGVREWVFDWFDEDFYAEAGRFCADCANVQEGIARVVRGDRDRTCCTDLDTEFRAAARNAAAPGVPLPSGGARCARDAENIDSIEPR